MAPQRSMLVTGGGSGLGAAIVAAATTAGYRVASLDTRPDSPPALPTAESNVDVAVPPEMFEGSVTDPTAVESVLDTFGVPDVVVNNAGVVRFGPLIDIDLDRWREVLEVNLTGALIVSQAVARRWIAEGRRGAIVNITSMNGVAAGPNAGAYGASKAGLALLTSQMALEWGPAGIRVNAVAPGLIDAGMSEPIYADGAIRSARSSKVPLGRLGTAADIAAIVLFLASSEADYITGQNLLVDGGVTGSIISHLPRPQAVDSVGTNDGT